MNLANIDIGGIFSGIGTLAKDLRTAITGNAPISAEKAAELAIKAQEIEASILNAQNQVNLAEAQNPNIFVSGWRPFIGWTCGIALCYNYIFMPFFTYIVVWLAESAPAMPTLDTGELTTLLIGMLGLGTLRTVEKTGVITKKP